MFRINKAMRLTSMLLACLWFSVFCAGRSYAEDALPVIVDGDTVNYDAKTNLISAEGDVTLEYKGVKVTCDRAQVNTLTNIGQLEGNVVVERDGQITRGEMITYDFNKRSSDISALTFVSEPFYLSGSSAHKVGQEKYELNDACFTTCGPIDGPRHFMDYTLRARRIEFYPHRKIVARNVILKIGVVPVLYIPVYAQPTKDRLPRVTIVPGYDSQKGFFMLSAWRYYMDYDFKGRIHLDYYANRGFASGLTHKYRMDELGEGVLKLYHIADKDRASFDDPPVYVGQDRYKVQLRHQYNGENGLNATVQINKFSDKYFMKDYFEREYESDTSPLSYAVFSRTFSHSSMSLLAQKRMNEFYSQLEYNPRLDYEIFKTRLGESDFYFESDNQYASMAYQYEKPSDADYDAYRVHTDNKFTYQNKFAWLNVSPYVRFRETYYSRNRDGKNDLTRTAFSTGLELSTKLYKSFSRDLKHIVTPIFTYDYTHDPTLSSAQLYSFDDIDSVSYGNNLSFKLENKLKARGTDKDGEDFTWDPLYFAPAVHYQLNQEGRGSHPSSVDYLFELHPWRDGLYLRQKAVHDIDITQRMTDIVTDINLDTGLVDLSIGHRYLKNEESQYTGNIVWRFAKRWSFETYLRYDDRLSKFEKQGFYLVRELNCWNAELGFTIDQDYKKTVWLMFTLKAFPDMKLNAKKSYSGVTDQNNM